MADAKTEDLFTNIKEYITLQMNILKLQLIDKIATLGSNLITALLIAFVALMTLILISITAALYFGELLNSNTLGFLIVASFYGLITVIFTLFRKKLIRNPLRDKLIHEFLKKKPE